MGTRAKPNANVLAKLADYSIVYFIDVLKRIPHKCMCDPKGYEHGHELFQSNMCPLEAMIGISF